MNTYTTDLQALKGRTAVIIRGMTCGSRKVEIFFSDLTRLVLWHRQDCCEYVELVDVAGDPEDLIGCPLALAEAAEARGTDDSYPANDSSSTTTWYKFVTQKGPVTLRWLGYSNGYYSESVDVEIHGVYGEDRKVLNLLSDEEKVRWDQVLENMEAPRLRRS